MSNAFATAFREAGLVGDNMNSTSPATIAASGAGTPDSTPTAPADKPKRQARIKTKSRGNNKRGHWGKSKTPEIIEWMHAELGTVMIQLKQLAFTGEVF